MKKWDQWQWGSNDSDKMSWESSYTLRGTNIFPENSVLKMIFPFPKVGYVSSLAGNHPDFFWGGSGISRIQRFFPCADRWAARSKFGHFVTPGSPGKHQKPLARSSSDCFTDDHRTLGWCALIWKQPEVFCWNIKYPWTARNNTWVA